MKYIFEFFKKEKNFFKGSGFILVSSIFILLVLNIFNKYSIYGKDKFLLILSFTISYELYRNGFDILFKNNKK